MCVEIRLVFIQNKHEKLISKWTNIFLSIWTSTINNYNIFNSEIDITNLQHIDVYIPRRSRSWESSESITRIEVIIEVFNLFGRRVCKYGYNSAWIDRVFHLLFYLFFSCTERRRDPVCSLFRRRVQTSASASLTAHWWGYLFKLVTIIICVDVSRVTNTSVTVSIPSQ